MDIKKEIESGKYLFKYCKFDTNALQILINKTLYFSSPDKLNDPLDSQYFLKIKNPKNFSGKTRNMILNSRFFLSDEIKYLAKDIGSDLGKSSSQEKLFKEYLTYLQNTYFGICCFSQIYNENLLWTHYTNEAKGFCIAFDKELLIDSLNQNFSKDSYLLVHMPITYKGEKKLEITLYKDGRIKQTVNHLFSKTRHWKYEKEYRFVLSQKPRHSFDFIPVRFDPFIEIDESCIKFVIVGERMQNEHIEIINNLKKKNIINAELYQYQFDK